MNEERTVKIEGRSNTNGQYFNSKIIAIQVKIVGNLVRGVSCVAKKLSAAMNILGTKFYYSGQLSELIVAFKEFELSPKCQQRDIVEYRASVKG
jgi:hypothetical protein